MSTEDIYGGDDLFDFPEARGVDSFGFDGEGGRTYYYEMRVDSGSKKATVQPLGEEEGKALIESRKAPEVRETP